ncbi:fluoride efflux transporter CrcB [Sodalis endosymbiont of Spalangia cameroni]|uniref:fluoride efflux transporter CrcB n=1 Tax=Sodalis praecaptivus TaxID=1239307 RepID=UPI0031F78EB4
MFALFSAVFIGGGIGSVLRWYVSVKLTHSGLPFPAGTLLVNLVGAFIIGLALALFPRMPQLDPAWKLLLTTGFCGGLTTFSAEAVALMAGGQIFWAAGNILLNLLGSLLMTAVAMGVVNWLAPPLPI